MGRASSLSARGVKETGRGLSFSYFENKGLVMGNGAEVASKK
jgi:hypothetical protein